MSTAAATDWLDHSFAGGLKTLDLSPGKDLAVGIAVQADGKVVVLANMDAAGEEGAVNVLRFLPDGALDAGFGVDGRFALEYTKRVTPIGFAIDPDGRIVVGGTTYRKREDLPTRRPP